MRTISLLAVAICLLCRAEAQQPVVKPSEQWKTYSYASDGFSIGSPQSPHLTSQGQETQYRIYWDEKTDVVINVSFNRKPVDCSAWSASVKGRVGNVSRVITISGNPALESTGPRNSLQAGYMLDQCADGRVYRFEAGWKQGTLKPPVIERVLSSFKLIPRRTN